MKFGNLHLSSEGYGRRGKGQPRASNHVCAALDFQLQDTEHTFLPTLPELR